MTDVKGSPKGTNRSRPRRAVVSVDGVEISGTPRAVEDFLDTIEADRRLADPANQRRIPLDELRAKRGL